MEKLQKALERARREREDVMETPHRARGKAGQVAAPRPEVWDTLTQMDLDPERLRANRVFTYAPNQEGQVFDVLRTKVFLMMKQKNWKRIAIISPDQGCGKTTVSCNLAIGFGRQQELNTLLLDLDLRQPGVARVLEGTPEHDIGDVLQGDVPAHEQMLRYGDNVGVMMAKKPIADPTRLLLSSSTFDVIDKIQRDFAADIMIFDLPPMLMAGGDARAILKNMDCALIIARAEVTKTSRLDICEREVGEFTNVMGIVLNDCRHFDMPEDQYSGY